MPGKCGLTQEKLDEKNWVADDQTCTAKFKNKHGAQEICGSLYSEHESKPSSPGFLSPLPFSEFSAKSASPSLSSSSSSSSAAAVTPQKLKIPSELVQATRMGFISSQRAIMELFGKKFVLWHAEARKVEKKALKQKEIAEPVCGIDLNTTATTDILRHADTCYLKGNPFYESVPGHEIKPTEAHATELFKSMSDSIHSNISSFGGSQIVPVDLYIPAVNRAHVRILLQLGFKVQMLEGDGTVRPPRDDEIYSPQKSKKRPRDEEEQEREGAHGKAEIKEKAKAKKKDEEEEDVGDKEEPQPQHTQQEKKQGKQQRTSVFGHRR